ncbi:aromatic ring-hydroxylating dioxygenase subunit alpha [Thermoleophilia bacterium SCSIO 60948]|nr:aromatic ring-hydroxylating dioxygenase subunit alpha [Thermoleophilia bacterium SCSIO 60948]
MTISQAAPDDTSRRPPTRTLPPTAYTDPELYADELREVFDRSWQLAGHVSELEAPGSYVTVQVGEEPVAVIRGHDGELRALSNVCRHRASLILEGSGICRKVMRCPYHAWTYRLDGRLAAAPSARGFNDFDPETVRLPRFRVEVIGGLVWACADDSAPPLRELLGPVAEFIDGLGLENLVVLEREGTNAASGENRQVEDYDENWKILADNYLEDYHVPIAHPALVRLLDVKQTDGDRGRWAEWSSLPMRDKPSKVEAERRYQELARRMPGLPERFERRWGHMCVWPATFFEIYPHHVDTWQLEPLGLGRTRARTMTLVHPEATELDREAIRLCHELQSDVMAEDIEITTRVQKGIRAPSYEAGILNDEWEPSVIAFQTNLRDLLPRIAELEREVAERLAARG